VIVVAVRWYLRFGLSSRDMEELLAERGVEVDHVRVGAEAVVACRAVRRIWMPGWSRRSRRLDSCRATKRCRHRRISRGVLPSATPRVR
jgi:transposase-like protein